MNTSGNALSKPEFEETSHEGVPMNATVLTIKEVMPKRLGSKEIWVGFRIPLICLVLGAEGEVRQLTSFN